MAKKWYGSVSARIEENKNYTKRELRAGDDITMYYWSDQHCYYITEVVDQKHLFVKQYHVCADHSKEGGQGHENWLYFKTRKEYNQYINSVFTDSKLNEDPEEDNPEEWVFRYRHWNRLYRYTQEKLDMIKARDGYCIIKPKNENEIKLLAEGKEIIRYNKIDEGISFGVRDYYYDWSF